MMSSLPEILIFKSDAKTKARLNRETWGMKSGIGFSAQRSRTGKREFTMMIQGLIPDAEEIVDRPLILEIVSDS
jgi:hypothetical protein